MLVDLPPEVGGARELDAAQIDAIINKLVDVYNFNFDQPDRERWEEIDPTNAPFFAGLANQVEAYNARIESLRLIVKKLRQAEQQ